MMNHERNAETKIRHALGLVMLVGALASGILGASAPLERLTGTVRAVDPRTHTVELLTGVGYALRVVRVVVPPELEVARPSGSATSPWTPGCIVRIDCRRSDSGRVATTVSLIRSAPRGRTP